MIHTKRRKEDPSPYKISPNKDKRVALILNHQSFDSFHPCSEGQEGPWHSRKFTALDPREGTKADSERLKKVLVHEKFNFSVTVKDDQNLEEIKGLVSDILERDPTPEIIAVFILTHGRSNGYLAAKDTWYSFDDVIRTPLTPTKD